MTDNSEPVGAKAAGDDVSIDAPPVVMSSSALLAAIVEGSDDAIISKSLDGTILSWNGGAERLYGWTSAEMIGQSILTTIPAERKAEEEAILAQIVRGKRVAAMHTSRLRKTGAQDGDWLSALEDTMARHGVAIEAARRGFVAELSRACARAEGPFPRARLDLDGEVNTRLAAGPALEAEDDMRARLATARRQDAETGGAAVGPHRSDLKVTEVESARPAAEGSTGEQKALLLSIVLSHARLLAAERGAAPLVLLDEVAAHLDPHRRRALFEEILALGAQVWLTGTEGDLFAELGTAAQVFAVNDGRLTPPGA